MSKFLKILFLAAIPALLCPVPVAWGASPASAPNSAYSMLKAAYLASDAPASFGDFAPSSDPHQVCVIVGAQDFVQPIFIVRYETGTDQGPLLPPTSKPCLLQNLRSRDEFDRLEPGSASVCAAMAYTSTATDLIADYSKVYPYTDPKVAPFNYLPRWPLRFSFRVRKADKSVYFRATLAQLNRMPPLTYYGSCYPSP